MRKVIILILSLFVATTVGCASETKYVGVPADMSEYDVETDRFIETTFSNFLEIKDTDTFAIYFGYTECHSCLEAVPVLNKVLEDENKYIYYINVRNEASYNIETDKEALLNILLEYYDERDTFGVPLIMFYKKGNLKYVMEGMRNPSEEMEKAILEGFDLLK